VYMYLCVFPCVYTVVVCFYVLSESANAQLSYGIVIIVKHNAPQTSHNETCHSTT